MIQESYLLVKPGMEQIGGYEEAISRLEIQGLMITRIKRIRLTREQVKRLYNHRVGSEFEREIFDYMTGGESILIEAIGDEACHKIILIKGKSGKSGLRMIFADNFVYNAFHCPDGEEERSRELKILEA